MFNKTNTSPDLGQEPTKPAPNTPELLQREPTPGVTGLLRTNLEINGAKPSVISEQFVLRGDIRAPGALHVEGTIIGNIEVASLTIGAKGVLEGDVVCTSLQIRGRFQGTAMCRDLFVANSAQIDGILTYKEMTVQRGAGLRGEMHLDA